MTDNYIKRYWIGLLMIGVCLSGVADSLGATEHGFEPLFNGKNFDGWYLKIRSGDEALAKKVFTVTDEGYVHVFGEGFEDGHKLNTGENDTHGLMYTDNTYTNYILRFEYKWGEKRLNNFKELQYDAGVYYHVYWDKIWPHGLEYQVRYDPAKDNNMTGDYWAAGTEVTWYAGDDGRFCLPSQGGKQQPRREKGLYRVKADVPFHGLNGKWNQCEVIVMANQYSIHKLNGEIVNMVTDMSEGKGKVGFQSETAEIFYRNIRIKQLAANTPKETFLEVKSTVHAKPVIGPHDRIGWSADGNRHDPDDWGATALALSIFAKLGWQERLVHFDYNNRLDDNWDWKAEEQKESCLGGAERYGFNQSIFFDDQTQLEAAVENAAKQINRSHEGSKFWYVQAGPFEVAYQALKMADPEKRKYCILVSHSRHNEYKEVWEGSHNKDDCVALGAGFFDTTGQGGKKFGGDNVYEWHRVDWLKESPCPDYRWVWSRMRKTAEHKHDCLDASDGGMAYVLATGDKNGNLEHKLKVFLGESWGKPGSNTTAPPSSMGHE